MWTLETTYGHTFYGKRGRDALKQYSDNLDNNVQDGYYGDCGFDEIESLICASDNNSDIEREVSVLKLNIKYEEIWSDSIQAYSEDVAGDAELQSDYYASRGC